MRPWAESDRHRPLPSEQPAQQDTGQRQHCSLLRSKKGWHVAPALEDWSQPARHGKHGHLLQADTRV